MLKSDEHASLAFERGRVGYRALGMEMVNMDVHSPLAGMRGPGSVLCRAWLSKG
jgi:hypothetical protein